MTDNRKTTVPGTSVGADAVQSSDKITTNIITNPSSKKSHCPYMPVFGQANQSASREKVKQFRTEHGINDRAVRHGVSTPEAHRERPAVQWHLPLCRSTQGGQVLLHGAARLPCGDGASVVGVRGASRHRPLSGVGG